MPETDPSGVRARTELLAHGWPDHLTWQPPVDVEAELDQLCTARRAAAAGLPGRLPEFAADFASMEFLGGIVDVVRWTALPKPAGWLPLNIPNLPR